MVAKLDNVRRVLTLARLGKKISNEISDVEEQEHVNDAVEEFDSASMIEFAGSCMYDPKVGQKSKNK